MSADARPVADKYISRGGGTPIPTVEEFSRDLLAVAQFILWHDRNDVYGGQRSDAAFAAFCRIVNVEQHAIRKIVLE